MKILKLGDTHFGSQTPIRRIDDFVEAQFNKLNFVIDYAINNMIDVIVQPGDLLNKSTDISYRMTNRLIRTLRQDGIATPVPILSISGNHSAYFRQQGTEHTAYTNIVYSKAVIDVPHTGMKFKDAVFYGCEYGREIPVPENPKAHNVLIAHVGVTNTELGFETNEKWWTPIELMKAHPDYNLILTGHNHANIGHTKYRSRHHINCGSLLRTNISQREHSPSFFVFDTETASVEEIIIPHDPAEIVFDLSKYENEKAISKELQSFSEGFKDVQISLDFSSRMDYYIREHDVEEVVVDEIYKCMGE